MKVKIQWNHILFDADSENEDAFENIIPDADAVDSVCNRSNQQSVTDLLFNLRDPSSSG